MMLYKDLLARNTTPVCKLVCNEIDDGIFGCDTVGTSQILPEYKAHFSSLPHYTSGGLSIGKYYVVSNVKQYQLVEHNVNPVSYQGYHNTWKISLADMIILKLGLDFKT